MQLSEFDFIVYKKVLPIFHNSRIYTTYSWLAKIFNEGVINGKYSFTVTVLFVTCYEGRNHSKQFIIYAANGNVGWYSFVPNITALYNICYNITWSADSTLCKNVQFEVPLGQTTISIVLYHFQTQLSTQFKHNEFSQRSWRSAPSEFDGHALSEILQRYRSGSAAAIYIYSLQHETIDIQMISLFYCLRSTVWLAVDSGFQKNTE